MYTVDSSPAPRPLLIVTSTLASPGVSRSPKRLPALIPQVTQSDWDILLEQNQARIFQQIEAVTSLVKVGGAPRVRGCWSGTLMSAI